MLDASDEKDSSGKVHFQIDEDFLKLNISDVDDIYVSDTNKKEIEMYSCCTFKLKIADLN